MTQTTGPRLLERVRPRPCVAWAGASKVSGRDPDGVYGWPMATRLEFSRRAEGIVDVLATPTAPDLTPVPDPGRVRHA